MVSVHEMKVVSVLIVRMATQMISINVDSSALHSFDVVIAIVLILFLVRVALRINLGMVLPVSLLAVVSVNTGAMPKIPVKLRDRHVAPSLATTMIAVK